MSSNLQHFELSDLHDNEIQLNMTLNIESRKEFYFKINKIDSLECIGTCCLLLRKNHENEYLGNIGYEIYPIHRGHNYAYKASLLLSKLALHYGVDNLIITANPSNLPSIKTITKLGAQYIDIKQVPKNHTLYKQGDRFLAIYEWNLKERGEENDRYKINKRR